MVSQWPAPSPDRYLNTDAPSAATLVRLPVLLCLSLSAWENHHGWQISRTSPDDKKKMSSLLKPFSVCEGPCESCGVRRGCASSPAHQQPPFQRLSAAAGLGSLPAHQRSYAARRNLAAAAVGGRKMTHPGKAILAGWFSFSFCNANINLAGFPPS